MALQSSGAISLNDIQTEFGGSNPIGINEYYGVAPGIPASGQISIGNFYGASAAPTYSITAFQMAGGGYSRSDSENGGYAGGGGGGGVLITTGTVSGPLSITVGGSTSDSGALATAIAGGYSRISFTTGIVASGGSGGGACGAAPAGSGTTGQGNPGGNRSSTYTGGGGGQSASGSIGPGGAGYYINNFKGGPTIMVAYGGGGVTYSNTLQPAGNGTTSNLPRPANSGGGASSTQYDGTINGGSGIVIIRYPGSTAIGSGGNSTYTATVGGTAYYFHEFTSSGTFTP